MSVFSWIRGGWRTWGPGNALAGPGAFDSGPSSTDLYPNLNQDTALRLGALWACLTLRAETIGSLPFHLRDDKKKIISDHPVYDLIHNSPNADQTPIEFWSLMTAHQDMHGNGIAIIDRRGNGEPIAMTPVDNPHLDVTLGERKNGNRYYTIFGDNYAAKDILHIRGFSMRNGWGLSRLEVGRHILSSQLTANEAAIKTFQSALKVGGFFKVGENLDKIQLGEFKSRLDNYALPENRGKWMTLLKGMEPVGGADYTVSSADAELLASRYMGIEEICRLMNTPPQLIGHTDKASSWASSIENINLFFLMYSLQPCFIRMEQRVAKTLLSADDRAKGIRPKFSIEGLLRANLAARMAFYASGLQNGYLNVNEVRDLEERGEVDGGDEYRVQMNMAGLGAAAPAPAAAPVPVAKPKPTKELPPPAPINIQVNVADRKAAGFTIVRDTNGNAVAQPIKEN